MKIKSVISAIVLSSCCIIAAPAIAQDGNLTQGPMVSQHDMVMQRNINNPHKMMMMQQHRMMQNAPVPMLMPVVIHHAIALKLTPEQDTKLMNKIKDMRQKFPEWHKSMMSDNKALRQALLSGESANTVKPLQENVDHDHNRMLAAGVEQVEFLHQLLTPTQWKMAVHLSEHPWAH